MIIKQLIQIGNSILSKKSQTVKDIKSKETKKIIKNMIDSMHHHNLIGIAAPQIGINQRIFITEASSSDKKELDSLRIFINPIITNFSTKQIVLFEGCGSVACSNLFAPVKRPKIVTIEAFDINGDKFKLKASGWLSRVIQHEYDHIDGICFIEKVHDVKKIMSHNEYIKTLKKS